MLEPSLYVVTRRPRRPASGFAPFFWFTHAKSAADAVRQARELLPHDFGPDKLYGAPLARRVSIHGSIWVC